MRRWESGGGRGGLMNRITNKNSIVPLSVELLFNNEKLDLVKTLSLLFVFSEESGRYRTVSETLFYYSLVNFELIKLFESNNEERGELNSSHNLYFRFQNKFNEILLNLFHLKFINIQGDISKKLEDTKISLNQNGVEFFTNVNSEYFSDLIDNYRYAVKKVKWSTVNVQKIKGVR